MRESERKSRRNGEEERDRETDRQNRQTHDTWLQTLNEATAGGRASSDNAPLLRNNQPTLIRDLENAGI